MKIDIRDITKFPNILTVIRIMLIPLFIIIFLWANGNIELNLKHFNKQNGYIIAAAIMILSGLTDMTDGLIARKFNMITDLGKVIDPFADKLTRHHVRVLKDSEAARSAYRKNPTPENALRLCDVLDGLERMEAP